jgi:hypothetical protein
MSYSFDYADMPETPGDSEEMRNSVVRILSLGNVLSSIEIFLPKRGKCSRGLWPYLVKR